MRYLFVFAIIFGLAGCSGTNVPEPTPEGSGSILTGRAEQGISLGELSPFSDGNNQAGLPINALLWRASLDIISAVPLDDVDTFGGTLITEWYQLDNESADRIKIAIFVLDKELRSDGIRVIVYVQSKVGDIWQDSGTDVDLGLKLEELILTRAREIRASGISQTN